MKTLLIFAVTLILAQTIFAFPEKVAHHANHGSSIPQAEIQSAKPSVTPSVRNVHNASAPAVRVSSDPTSCSYRRDAETRSKTQLPGRVIPNCLADGSFAPLQCHGNTTKGDRFCQCWDRSGNIIRAPSRKIKACDCILAQHEANSKRPRPIGAFIPQCSEDGHFNKHQCHGSTGMCWCAHPVTGETIGEKRRGVAATACQ